jgi:hypothetical protein
VGKDGTAGPCVAVPDVGRLVVVSVGIVEFLLDRVDDVLNLRQ